MNRNYNNSRQLISEMKYMLESKPHRKLTLEGMVFGEDGEEMMGDDQEMDDEGGMSQMGGQMPQGRSQMPQGGQSRQMDMGMGDGMDENPLDGDPEITKLITNIRVETLQGMTKLAQNPESAQYELLKKIFLLVDKAVEDKVDPEKQGR